MTETHMHRAMVLGASGMLGSMVLDYLARDASFSMAASVRAPSQKRLIEEAVPGIRCELMDARTATEGHLRDMLADADWAINAIGITKPYIREDNPGEIDRAIRTNALFPHTLARAAEQSGCHVLQIATDCVYSGLKGNYVESDEHDPLDVYGKTKSLGEVYSPNVHHLRGSIIGPEPKAHVFLLDWFLRQPHHARLNGFTNHLWNGMTTLHFAKLCRSVIVGGIEPPHVQHVTAGGNISKADMLRSFQKSYHREDIEISETVAAKAIDRTLATQSEALHRQLWLGAGYDSPPTVPEMIDELAHFRARWTEAG
ncbi:MAG: sugar nucleotide-binding protein [Thermodesulfobacteriota bacterium]